MQRALLSCIVGVILPGVGSAAAEFGLAFYRDDYVLVRDATGGVAWLSRRRMMSTLAAASVSALLPVSAFAAGNASSDMIPVVVTLKGLGAGPAWAERIAQARERVKRALQGHHVVINREYDMIPALALSVDERGSASCARTRTWRVWQRMEPRHQDQVQGPDPQTSTDFRELMLIFLINSEQRGRHAYSPDSATALRTICSLLMMTAVLPRRPP